MYIGYTEEQEALRRELRAYYAELLTPEVEEGLAHANGVGEVMRSVVRRVCARPQAADARSALAGPVANLIMAIIFAIPIRLGLAAPSPGFGVGSFELPSFFQFCLIGVQINLLLFAFNLMPIPPLDGFTILMGILPPEMAYRLTPLRQYGTIILLVVIFLLPRLGLDVLGWFVRPVFNVVLPVLVG